jgi:pseudouridine-5'-phosphate glycosidase
MEQQHTHPYMTISPEVRQALAEQQPVVALESTVISHGLPYPANLAIAQAMEQTVRAEGATPATIGIHDGQIMIGLSTAEINHLATAPDVQKVSRRDLAATLASGRWGATTVAGTMLCANMAGIRFFATGGIGGVHRGATSSMDISADLQELGRTPVLVTCAGAKSILDLDLTMQYLETMGIPVIGWQTSTLPAFYVRDSGRPVPNRVDDLTTLTALARAQWGCGLAGILVTCPIPQEYAMPAEPLERAIEAALQQAQAEHIQGAALTPFLLAHIAKSTTGESIEANKALLLNNARWAARFSCSYSAR